MIKDVLGEDKMKIEDKKIDPEKATRRGFIEYARLIGAEEELKKLFHKWDTLMALAPADERAEMSKMGILEIQELLLGNYVQDGLTINGEIVVKAK